MDSTSTGLLSASNCDQTSFAAASCSSCFPLLFPASSCFPPARDLRDERRDHFLCRCLPESTTGAEPKSLTGGLDDLYNPTTHVTLPCYNESRWSAIKTALNNIVTAGPSLSFTDFKQHVLSYTAKNGRVEPDFFSLQELINSGWYGDRVLSDILPSIARLALELNHCFRKPVRLLLAGRDGSLTMSQRQVAVLLANAFYCTFPRRDLTRFPRINFYSLFRRGTFRGVEKTKFLLHYFAQFTKYAPHGTLSIIRQHVGQLPNGWQDTRLTAELVPVVEGRIEDEPGSSQTQLDFANEFIGGGVLGHGAVQEEIRFLICPELIASCLICERMRDDEAILLIGAERFSNYQGYNKTLLWRHREYQQNSARDCFGRALRTELLAIDALPFPANNANEQYSAWAVNRELLKTCVGFSLRTPQSPMGIATGNWGCGVFGGDRELKALIQWMAASLVDPLSARPLFYFTFGDQQFADELNEIVLWLRNNNVSAGKLYAKLLDFGHAIRNGSERPRGRGGAGLFNWIRQNMGTESNIQTDEDGPLIQPAAAQEDTTD